MNETEPNIGVQGKENLGQRVESAFNEAVANRLKGKEPEKTSSRVKAEHDDPHPVLTFLIQDQNSRTKTWIEIPIGLADPENNDYFARMWKDGRPRPDDYQRYSSPEDIGYEAAKAFSHHYTVDVMGI